MLSRGRRARRALLLAVLVAALTPATAAAQGDAPCLGEYFADNVPQRPGPAMRFGTVPSGAAGQVGLPSTFKPDRTDKILEALAKLRPPGAPFVTHSYSSWKDAGADEDRRLVELSDRYTSRGYLWELVARYYPDPEREGDVAGFAEHVRHLVRLLGPNPGVVAMQITNEVNFTASPDSSDGAFEGARDALIQGVIAAKDEARKRGYDHLKIGFNWLYRLDTYSERTFWEHLRDRGGPAFVAAVDWIGLDAYPGTFFPPSVAPGEERDFVVNALSLLRCYSASARLPASKPIHVQENGYPTGPGRSYDRQLQALETMVQAFHDFRGTYNVADYRWFNMRDAETESPNFQQQYGLLRDDYTPKPAFGAFARYAATLGARSAGSGPGAPGGATYDRRRPRLSVRGRRARTAGGRRCLRSPVTVKVVERARRSVRSVEFLRGRRVAARDRRRPFRRRVRYRVGRRERVVRVRARVTMADGRRLRLTRRVRLCGPR